MSIIARLGNNQPLMQIVDHDGAGNPINQRAVPAPHLQQSITTLEFADYVDDDEFIELTRSTDNDRFLDMVFRLLPDELDRWAVAVNEAEQIWASHSGGGRPAWVAASDPGLQAALALHFGCPEGEPTALLTNTGRDALHAQHLSTSAQPAAFNYMALANSATATTPNATDTTLTGEITTGGGGLVRKQGTYAHTAGTNTSTITATFTGNGSDSYPVTVSQDALFNAASAGTMGYKTALNSPATINVSGDNVTVTHTITGG